MELARATRLGFALLATAAAFAVSGCDTSQFTGEACVITATGNKLCGGDATAWCNATDDLRAGDSTLGIAPDSKSQAVCDEVRAQ
jgi:hypothetical protein